jgi:hypothetical protein
VWWHLRYKFGLRDRAQPVAGLHNDPDRTAPSSYQVPNECHTGLHAFRNAKNILAGIELMHRIRKDPLELARVVFKEIAV